jgi:hypothetical protein
MRQFLTTAACVALVGQLGVMLGTLGEGRDGQGTRAHVEQAGTSIHYAHGDNCGLCQARSLQSMASLAPSVGPGNPLSVMPSAAVEEGQHVSDVFLQSPPRAPPQLS